MVVTDVLKFLVFCWVLSAIIAGCEQGIIDYNNTY